MQGPVSPVILRGNCFDHLKTLPDAAFDLLLTDPPYGTTALDFDKIKIDWGIWWEEVHRVCRPTAPLVCFAAQPFATDLINSNRKHFRYDLVWHKTSPVGFLSANVRPLRAHELILVFCRKFGRYQEKRGEAITRHLASVYNPQMTTGTPYLHKARSRTPKHYNSGVNDVTYQNAGTRHPTSVLTYGRDVPSQHPTQKPTELMRWLVRTYSHAGDRVLDPFAGSGSTGVACVLEGREFVGIELDEEFARVAEERLAARK